LGWKGFFKYFGPGIIAAVAYIDPGNYGTDISAGASFGYTLLWAVLLANLMGMLLQYLSGKIGIATGKSLAELIRGSLKTRRRIIPYWLSCEIFAVFTDLAEFLGVTSALYLLSGGRIPLLYAAWISAFDVIVIFALAGRKFRRLELLITLLVFGIGMGYVYEIFVVRPSAIAVAAGMLIPIISSNDQLILVVGIVGATVMPHALIIQSWLTKNKTIELGGDKKQMLRFHTLDTTTTFIGASLINMAILIMAAAAFFLQGLNVATINDAYTTLIPLFGIAASIIFAVTLLFSGISSSTVGVMAGQAILEGLLGSKLNPWFRRIILRVINVIPTSLAIMAGLDPLLLLTYSQVVLSLLIPLPLIPLVYYTCKKSVMGEFVNKPIVIALALLTTGVIITLNVLLLVTIF
jgi:manganese transport protein